MSNGVINRAIAIEEIEQDMTSERPSYYAIIPADVRYDKELTPNAKLLYGEITALCGKDGRCWAENRYFADLYGVSKTSISKWIKALSDKGYISCELVYKKGTKEIERRYIRIVSYPIEEKLSTPIEEKLKENNTRENNIKRIYISEFSELPQEKQSVEKQGVENQCVEILSVENPTQLNTNKSNTKELNKEIESRYIRIVSYPIEEKLSTPIEEKLNTPIEEKLKENNTRFNTTRENNIKRIYISEFLELWTLYPNKKGKEKALSAYIKARESGTEKETVEKGIKDYAKECELKGREKDYIKYGSTWFNQHGWEDEYDLTPARKISPAKQAYSRKDDTDLTGIL